MLEKPVRWLLPLLLLAAISVFGQRPAPRKLPVRRPATSVKKPAPVVPKTEMARVVSVSDTARGLFIVPQIKLSDTAVAARVNRGLVDAAMGEDLEAVPEPLTARAAIQQAHAELANNDQLGFTNCFYEVLYNDHGLLSVEFTSDYMAAYPSSIKRHATFDLRTGRLVEVRDLVADTLALRQRWQQSMNRRVAGHLQQLPTDYPQLDTVMLAEIKQRLYWNAPTSSVQLDAEEPRFYDFALTPFGLVLYYDFGFPHVMQALQPDPDYLFRYADIKLWLKPKGPLDFK